MSHNELIDRGWEAYDREDLEEAEALARRALMVEESSVEARCLLAQTMFGLEAYGAALPLLREAAGLEPEDPDVRTLLGIALFELCQFALAHENLLKARDTGADSAEIHYRLGLSFERRGDYTAADAAFARAHRRDPDGYPLPKRISREAFLQAVEEARSRLPGEFDACLENVAIRAEDLPSEEILEDGDPPMDPCLLGLFVGVPLDERHPSDATPRLPDMVFLFQRNLERCCDTRETLVEEIRTTLYHELGHYLGYDEDELVDRGVG